MKPRFLIILLAVLVNNSIAQSSRDICSSQITTWTDKPASYTSATEAKNMINEIIAVIGLKPNFEVLPANVDNAAAVVYMNKRYILYNPDFISRLNAAAGNKWASISILAHEIGHHLNGHTIEYIGSQPDKELEADEFSGFVLRRLGATLAQSQEAMRIAGNYKRSLTHPGQDERLVAIEKGWNTANQQQGGKDLAKTTPTFKTEQKDPIYTNKSTNDRVYNNDKTNDQQVVIRDQDNSREQQRNYPTVRTSGVKEDVPEERNILADINFIADQQSSFYLTSEFNIVKLLNNRLYSIGKMRSTNNTNYPFVMTDENGTTLWVDNNGNIINGSYRSVGYLKVR